MKIDDPHIVKKLNSGRWKAIIKMVGERRMFLGIERVSRRSRKYKEKLMCAPQDLSQIVNQHQHAIRKQSESAAQPSPGGDSPSPSEGTGEDGAPKPPEQPNDLGAGNEAGR